MELTDTKAVENKEEWLEWRKAQPKTSVFGSSFPIWFGQGYGLSLKQHLEVVHGRKEAVEPDHFTRRAMDHGVENEERAFEWFKQSRNEIEYPEEATRKAHNHIFFRDLPSVVLKDEDCVVCVTPDAVIVESRFDFKTGEEYQVLQVVEIKCPVRMASKYDSLEEWMTDFTAKHPLGYTSAFLQALLYSAIDSNTEEFYTAFYFQHKATNMEGMRVYKFALTDDLRKFALDNAKEFSRVMRTDDQTKARVPSARKKLAAQWQDDAHVMDWISTPRFICFNDSNEQNSKESGQE